MSKTNHDQRLRVRDWVTAIIVIIFFGASAVIMVVFGFEDIYSDANYGVRLRAAAMILDALYFAVSAAAVVRVLRKPSAAMGAVVLVGGVVSGITGVMLLAYQLIRGDLTPWLLAWLGMAAGGTFVTVRLLQAGARFPYPKQSAIAATVTGLLTAANFAYISLYQPTAQPAQLQLEVEIRTPAFNTQGTLASIPIKVSSINTGKVGLYVVTAVYSVVGRRGSISDTDRTVQEMNLVAGKDHPALRGTIVGDYEFVGTSTFLQGVAFNPGDRYDMISTIDLPEPKKYDLIRLRAIALVVREEDVGIESLNPSNGELQVNAPRCVADPDAILLSSEKFRISETNRLRQRTRQEWVGTVLTYRGSDGKDPPVARISYCFEPRWSLWDSDQRDYTREAEGRYGLMLSDTRVHEKSAYELKLR